MALDIKPVDGDSYAYACVDVAIINVAVGLKKGYEMSYSECWDFSYKDALKNSDITGSRIGEGGGNKILLLQKYHGLKVVYTSGVTASHALELVKDGLASGIPSVVIFDTFFAPWNLKFYQKIHDTFGHGIIIKGIDQKINMLYCIDPHYESEALGLPVELFLKGYCDLINFEECGFTKDFDYVDIVRSAARRLFDNNAFEAIRRFGHDIKCVMDMKPEIDGYEIMQEAPLFFNLKQVSQARRRFAATLSYLNAKFNDTRLLSYADRLDNVYFKWEKIYSRLAYVSLSFKRTYIENISNNILELAQIEQEIAEEMLDFSREKITDSCISCNEDAMGKDDAPVEECSETLYLDLSRYFNNKGIGGSPASKADITGHVGEFMLMDRDTADGKWEIGGITFKFPEIAEGKNDNISCNGACIGLPGEHYNEIRLLGCSEWGHYQDDLKVNFADGDKEALKLGFTNYESKKTRFGEDIAYTGKRVFRGELTDENMSIFAQSLKIKNKKAVKSICLPDCPSMHIFAISLR